MTFFIETASDNCFRLISRVDLLVNDLHRLMVGIDALRERHIEIVPVLHGITSPVIMPLQ